MGLVRIVWVCDVNSRDIAEFLPEKVPQKENAAPFDTLFRQIFENHTDKIELHIIAVYEGLSKSVSFIKNKIYFHILSVNVPFQKYSDIINIITQSMFYRRIINKKINDIRPDIVCVFGTELLRTHVFTDIKFPKILIIQGLLHLYRRHNEYDNLRFFNKLYMDYLIKQEIKSINHAVEIGGIRTKALKALISSINDKARLHYFWYPINIPQDEKIPDELCDADIVFAARVNPQKGIEDLIFSIGRLNFKNIIIVKVIGHCDEVYKNYLNELALKNSCWLVFKGYLSSEKMFEEISSSRLFVLPTYFDIIPGTLISSMFIGTPIIAYETDGIPELNEKNEALCIVERGNIERLKEAIKLMLESESVRKRYSENAKLTIKNYINNESIFTDMMNAFNLVISR